MTKLSELGRDRRGATAIEMAFALPVLVTLMIGLLQFAQVMHANGALRHTAGQSIRFAKVYPNAPVSQVLAEARSNLADLDQNKITELSLERGTAANGGRFARITIGYELKPVIPFAPIPAIPLRETRTAYLPS